MGMIRIYERKSKPAKKKPGWQKAAQEYAEWEAKINSMKLFSSPTRPVKKISATVDPVVRGLTIEADRLVKLPSRQTFGGGATKTVPRPEIQYRDNPELLARELVARQRKFNVAPAFNKGADQLVTEEELTNLLRSNKRRS